MATTNTFYTTLLALIAPTVTAMCFAQTSIADNTHVAEKRMAINAAYTKREVMIAMRDGKRLHTTIYEPKEDGTTYPIILNRTPYGNTDLRMDANGIAAYPGGVRNESLHDSKFIFVLQDVRGMFESADGDFEDFPIMHTRFPNSIRTTDESTDAYDTIEWLLHNTKSNNGKVGLYGLSYRGFYAIAGILSQHPAISAVVLQAPVNGYEGDVYRGGGFTLIQNFNWYQSYLPYTPKTPSTKPFPAYPEATKDAYSYFNAFENTSDLTEKSRLGANSYWIAANEHPSYDQFWKKRDILAIFNSIKNVPPVLIVGGWYDLCLVGSIRAYNAFKGKSSDLHLIIGPWWHGAWSRNKFRAMNGDSLGNEHFGEQMAEAYQTEAETPFLLQHLKGGSPSHLPAVKIFVTGENKWIASNSWPSNTANMVLYPTTGGKLKLDNKGHGSMRFVSDPKNPVPYGNDLTVEGNDAVMVADQTAISSRNDVLTFSSDTLPNDLVVSGIPVANLTVATTGNDSDWVVKIIDVSEDGKTQRLVRADLIRARYRNGFDTPRATPVGRAFDVKIKMLDMAHCFKAGHRVMIQIQSSIFPFVDSNPQTFTNVYNAPVKSFKKQVHTLFVGKGTKTNIILPTMN